MPFHFAADPDILELRQSYNPQELQTLSRLRPGALLCMLRSRSFSLECLTVLQMLSRLRLRALLCTLRAA